jgi:hypothetical protein
LNGGDSALDRLDGGDLVLDRLDGGNLALGGLDFASVDGDALGAGGLSFADEPKNTFFIFPKIDGFSGGGAVSTEAVRRLRGSGAVL